MKYKVSSKLERILKKLRKKDKVAYARVRKKIMDVVRKPESYKNLRHDLGEMKRVHIGSFVLTFKFDKKNDLVTFLDYDHHDKIYR